MTPMTITYGLSTELPISFDEALTRTRAALAAEGFGVLCEIDVAETLKQKLGADIGPYTILGACNPPLAHRALTADPNIGLLLPCNVVVRAGQEPGWTVVSAIDPEKQMQITDEPGVAEIARAVGTKLWNVLLALGATESPRPAV